MRMGDEMKIIDILNQGRVEISCEIFPPKIGGNLDNVKKVVREIAELKPSYMSVTYGADGGNSENSVDVAKEVAANNVPVLAHFTCVASDKKKVDTVLTQLQESKIQSILALRGDLPEDGEFPAGDRYRHASELVAAIKSKGDFCVAGACYPEGHPESADSQEDIYYIKEKVNCGCDFLVTQMFFDNNILYNFMYKTLKAGIDVPVVPGIMPVTSARQVESIIKLSGSLMPEKFLAIVDRFGKDPESMKQAGIAYATDQIIDLIANGINHVHIYTMNKPEVAGTIMNNLSSIIQKEK